MPAVHFGTENLGAHVLSGRAQRARRGPAAAPPDEASAAVPVGFGSREPDVPFEGGIWGLVKLPGTGYARREN